MYAEKIDLVLVAGESSGDQLAAVLLQGAQANYAQVSSAGIVGDAMQKQGAQAWWPSQSLAVRGYFEPIRHLPRILNMRRELITRRLTRHQNQIYFFCVHAAPNHRYRTRCEPSFSNQSHRIVDKKACRLHDRHCFHPFML